MFFFKQKKAYEVRISDWSSAVCSSDLAAAHFHGAAGFLQAGKHGFLNALGTEDTCRQDDEGESGGDNDKGDERTQKHGVGTENVSTCKSRKSTYLSKKKHINDKLNSHKRDHSTKNKFNSKYIHI